VVISTSQTVSRRPSAGQQAGALQQRRSNTLQSTPTRIAGGQARGQASSPQGTLGDYYGGYNVITGQRTAPTRSMPNDPRARAQIAQFRRQTYRQLWGGR
jgi:hypothetical protein